MATGDTLIQTTVTVLNGLSYSPMIRVPRNCSTVTIFQPAALSLPGNDTYGEGSDLYDTFKIQTMLPGNLADPDNVPFWLDAYYIVPGTPNSILLAIRYSANTAVSFPSWTLGGGNIRIQTMVNQSANATFTFYFSGFYN